MPTAERYAQYRADQTTIWVSKRAAESLARERAAGESTAVAVDRLFTELRSLRRGQAAGTGAKAPARGRAAGGETAGASRRQRAATKGGAKAGATKGRAARAR